jgi:hypothetical protein
MRIGVDSDSYRAQSGQGMRGHLHDLVHEVIGRVIKRLQCNMRLLSAYTSSDVTLFRELNTCSVC